MKKTFAPLVCMGLFALALILSSVAQGQTAIATVDETIVFDEKTGEYLSSKDEDVANTYTHAVITGDKLFIKFQMNRSDGEPVISEYMIVKRRNNSRKLLCTNIDTGKKILIEQKKNSMTVNCEYDDKNDRYNAAIVFDKLKFKSKRAL
jgi:hypothetical protein